MRTVEQKRAADRMKKRRVRAERVRRGLCLSCGKRKCAPGFRTCELCRERLRVRPEHRSSDPSANRYSDEQWEEMIAAYTAGRTVRQAVTLHGASPRALRLRLRSRGIPVRDSEAAYDLIRRPYRKDRFRDMATEEEAYWLGMLYTDGCVSPKRNRTALALCAKDAAHVQGFAEFMGVPGAVHTRRFRSTKAKAGFVERSTCSVFSAAVVANLARHGMYARKTYSIQPWDGPAHLMRHFWRGCVDGDGCIHRVKTPSGRATSWVIELAGNEPLVRAFMAFVTKATGRPGHLAFSEPNSDGWRMARGRWCGRLVCKAIAGLLYSDVTVSLARKQALADELMGEPDRIPLIRRLKHVTRDELAAWFVRHRTIYHVANAMGVSYNAVKSLVHHHGFTKATISRQLRLSRT